MKEARILHFPYVPICRRRSGQLLNGAMATRVVILCGVLVTGGCAAYPQAGHTEAPEPARRISLESHLLLTGRPHTDIWKVYFRVMLTQDRIAAERPEVPAPPRPMLE